MELKNAWDKATSDERAEFMRHAGLAGRTAPPVSTGAPARPIFTQRHSFEPVFATWLEAEMDNRGMKPGQLMKILGASTLDQSVSMALRNDSCLHNQSLRQALSQWASANGWR